MSSEPAGTTSPQGQPDHAPDPGADLSEWQRFIRRARIGDPKKMLAALVIATYANNDGSSIKCGVARFATDCEMGYSTARRYLAWLRDVELIELVRAGNRKARRADEYRLTITDNTRKLLDTLEDEEYRDLAEGVSAANRSGEKTRRLRSPRESADSREGANPSALTPGQSAENSICAHLDPYLRSPMGELPPPTSTSQEQAPPTGGAPPPDPRRPPEPAALGNDSRKPTSEPITPPPALQRHHRPRARAAEPPDPEHLATVTDIRTWEAS